MAGKECPTGSTVRGFDAAGELLCTSQGGNILYEEHFSNGIPFGWIELLPSWSVIQEGETSFLRGLYPAPDRGAKIGVAFPGLTIERPLRVEARVRFLGVPGDEFLIAFILGYGQFERFGYGLNVDTGWHAPRWVHAYREDATDYVHLTGSDPVDFRDGLWHTVALELLDDGVMRGYYDGAQVFSYNDGTYSTFNTLLLGTSADGPYDWDYIRILACSSDSCP